MKHAVNYLGLLLLLLAGHVLAGCATIQPDLAQQGIVTVDVVRTHGISIDRAQIYQEGDELLVRGTVRRQRFYGGFPGGHAHITVLSPEGEVVGETAARYPAVLLSPKRRASVSFAVRLPLVVQPGSVVRIVRHATDHSEPQTGASP